MTTGIAPAPRWTTRRTATTPPIAVGPAGPADATALRAMYDRCGPATRYARFHGLLRELPDDHLAGALAGNPAVHDALVVEVAGPGGRHLVGLGSACRLDRPGPPAADVGLLVEDAWQRRGLGALLLAVLAARARARGVAELHADVLASARGLLPALASPLGPVAVRAEGITVHASVRLEEAGSRP
jgi:GNAT superfamily N-acetyltransferase